MTTSADFPKANRLLNAADFQRVFDQAIRVFSRYYLLLVCNNELSRPRLGLVVGKKKFAKAVMRNAVKRNIRESFRLHKDQLPNVDIVVLPHGRLNLLTSAEMQQEINKLWKKLIRQCEKSSST